MAHSAPLPGPAMTRPPRLAQWLEQLRQVLDQQRRLDEQALRLQIRKRNRP